jgi:hypothetical protein
MLVARKPKFFPSNNFVTIVGNLGCIRIPRRPPCNKGVASEGPIASVNAEVWADKPRTPMTTGSPMSAIQAAAAFLLLNGAWILVFGVSLARGRDRLYYSGWGVVMASLSTFAILPLQYVLGVVVVAIMLVVVAGIVARPKKV